MVFLAQEHLATGSSSVTNLRSQALGESVWLSPRRGNDEPKGAVGAATVGVGGGAGPLCSALQVNLYGMEGGVDGESCGLCMHLPPITNNFSFCLQEQVHVCEHMFLRTNHVRFRICPIYIQERMYWCRFHKLTKLSAIT